MGRDDRRHDIDMRARLNEEKAETRYGHEAMRRARQERDETKTSTQNKTAGTQDRSGTITKRETENVRRNGKRHDRRDEGTSFFSRRSNKLNANNENEGTPFCLSPDPLPPAFPCLRASNNPPPPGGGTSGRERISHAGGMIIAGGKDLPCRSLTAFVRYSVFIAGVCFRAVFCQLILPFRGGVYSVARGDGRRSRPFPP